MFQIYSYAGVVRVGVVSNKFFIQKPRLLCKCIHEAYLELKKELDAAEGNRGARKQSTEEGKCKVQ